MADSESRTATGTGRADGGASPARGESGEASAERAVTNGLHCSTCGADVPPGVRSCPVCRRGVYRTCFCGWRLPADEATCPSCGADWSQSVRVSRKSRSRKPRKSGMLRAAALGALAAAVAALVIHVTLWGFARLAVNDQQAVPVDFIDRIRLALSGIAGLIGRAGAYVAAHAQTIALAAGILVLGAVAGIVVHRLRRGHRRGHSSRTSRRVRRRRR